MTDDPREILSDVELECPALDEYAETRASVTDWTGEHCLLGHEVWQGDVDPLVLSLSRMVHRYKWQRDDAAAMLVEEHCGPLEWVFEELDRDYAEHMKGRE